VAAADYRWVPFSMSQAQSLAVLPPRGDPEGASPGERLEQALHPWVAFGVMPVFALANAGLDLHGINVAWSDMSRVNGGCDPDLPRTNLNGAIAYRALFVDAKLCDAILNEADLHGSDLSGAALEDATLNGANLSWTVLSGAGAAFAPFDDANLSNAIWRDGAANGASFDGADLHRIDLRNTDLRSTSFVGTDLRYAQLGGVDLTNADLTGADWRGAAGLASATFSNTTCPDGTNSDTNTDGTCAGH